MLEKTGEWADGLRRARLPPGRDLIAAAIAAGETAYYISAAIETHPRRRPNPGRNDSDRHFLKSLEVYDRLYAAMGGPGCGTITPRELRRPYCTKLSFAPGGETEYSCNPDILEENQEEPRDTTPYGNRPSPCAPCPYTKGKGRPLPSDLLREAA